MTSIPLPMFPNYTQMRQPLSVRAWHALRVASVAAALGLCLLLIVSPDVGLTVWWGIVAPALPLVFFVAPGLWRNLCPMAALNQTPRLLGFTRGLTLPPWLREYGYVIGAALFFAIVPARKVLFNDNGPALALLLLGALAAAYVGGLVFKGKGGWCSSGVCPLYAVQRVYGQTPFVTVPNSHCRPCVGCAKNCYDFNPAVAYLADMHDDDHRYSGYRKVFVGAFPGLIVAFYTVPDPPEIATWEMYARFALAMLASLALLYVLETFTRVSPAVLAALFGAAALNLYYWYNIPRAADRLENGAGIALPDPVLWLGSFAVLALTMWWLARTVRKERLFLARSAAPASPSLALSGTIARRQARGLGQPEVTFAPEGRRVVVERGRTLLEIAEKNDLRIEAGCRMGVCGADPVAVVTGMENCSPIGEEEQNTLERLGLAKTTRMACVCRVRGDVTVSLKPERPKEFSSSIVRGFRPDPAVGRVVVIGNGIAGVTAADHVRRRHPMAEIDVVAREQHHLYNRMAIERLVYGRSAMRGLYLQEESWYDDLKITVWLNTRAARIDREARQVVLGTGETLPYDRLILAMGSSSVVPPIAGFGLPGTFVMREADDALAIRAFAQEQGCREAVIAGGGLLGLEAAYALHKLGLHVSVLERSAWPLRRQLDARGGAILRAYLEGLGIAIVTDADTAGVTANGRVKRVTLKDGRTLPCDLFLACAGIMPNVDLARTAGLDVNRGVLVDDGMRTSDPAIFAAGDVAEHHGQIAGLWPAASEQAQVAAVNAVGGDRAYQPAPAVTMLKVVGVDLTSIGRFEPQSPDDTMIALEDADGQRYRKLVIGGGRIAGAILIGYPQLSPVVSSAIKRNADVGGCLDALRAGAWDVLGELPEDMQAQAPVAAVAPAAPATPIAPSPAPQPPAPPPARPVIRSVQPEPEPVRPAPAGEPLLPVAPRAEPPAFPDAPAPAPFATPPAVPAAAGPPAADSARPAIPRLLLQIAAGPATGKTFVVTEEGATLGRSPDNEVWIADEGLSRRHARIEWHEGAYWVADLGSTNGTAVNGVRLSAPHLLGAGDVIRIGTTRLDVTVAGGR